jgi:hypothetical protein
MRDLDAYGRFLADDCAMRFNNEPPTAGKAAVLRRLRDYWQSFRSIEHDLLSIYGEPRAFMLEALNHYVRLNNRPMTCRAVALTDRNAESLVTAMRFYTDVSALFA